MLNSAPSESFVIPKYAYSVKFWKGLVSAGGLTKGSSQSMRNCIQIIHQNILVPQRVDPVARTVHVHLVCAILLGVRDIQFHRYSKSWLCRCSKHHQRHIRECALVCKRLVS